MEASGGLAGRLPEREFGGVDAVAGVQPDAVGCCEGYAGDGGVADSCGELDEVVDGGVGRGSENLVFLEGLEAQDFTAHDFASGQGGAHVTHFIVGDLGLWNTGTFGEPYVTSEFLFPSTWPFLAGKWRRLSACAGEMAKVDFTSLIRRGTRRSRDALRRLLGCVARVWAARSSRRWRAVRWRWRPWRPSRSRRPASSIS